MDAPFWSNVAPENESDELMYQATDSVVITFDQDHPEQDATVPIAGDCQEVKP